MYNTRDQWMTPLWRTSATLFEREECLISGLMGCAEPRRVAVHHIREFGQGRPVAVSFRQAPGTICPPYPGFGDLMIPLLLYHLMVRRSVEYPFVHLMGADRTSFIIAVIPILQGGGYVECQSITAPIRCLPYWGSSPGHHGVEQLVRRTPTADRSARIRSFRSIRGLRLGEHGGLGR